MKRILSLFLVLGLFLTACNAQKAAEDVPSTQAKELGSEASQSEQNSPVKMVSEPAAAGSASQTTPWPDGQAQADGQGHVEVTVIPVNLSAPAETLNFEVSLETHSVDLSMDLALLSTLVSDNGLSITGSVWDAPTGGHHVGGNLIFAVTEADKELLSSASSLTMTIRDVDAAERSFTWNASR